MNQILPSLTLVLLFCGCIGSDTNQGITSTTHRLSSISTSTIQVNLSLIPKVIDYHGWYIFNCEPSEEYPIRISNRTETISAGIENITAVARKSKFKSCTFADNDVILWDMKTDNCLTRETSKLVYFGAKPFNVTGFFGEFEKDGYDTFKKFYVTKIPDHSYVCCNICCNMNSSFYSKQKQCFWYNEDESKVLPADYILNHSFTE
ncbi:MAG: hypothetical protein V1875_02450 [Candidatus Altiarchaeota archaeon]